MRTLLALVVATGLPLCAVAQPVADNGKSTEVSGLTVEAHEAADCPIPPGPNGPNKWFDAAPNSKNKRTEESAGTRAFVLMMVAGINNNNVDYTHMAPGLAKGVREQGPRVHPGVVCQGVLKGIKFLHVSQDGFDDFEVEFSNGALEWMIQPFDSHQVTSALAFRYFYPQPASKQFDDWLKSIERGRPNYADLTPDFAAKLQAQWPALQTSLKDWGRLKGFRFVRQDDDGAYVYLAAYEHRRVVWTVVLPNADGKFTALTYNEKIG